MPPRIPVGSCLRTQSSSSTPSVLPRLFSSSSSVQAKKQNSSRKPSDLYAAQYRKSANLSRRAVLQKERTDSLGDPVLGVPTPFVESFDTARLPPNATATSGRYMRPKAKLPAEPAVLAHFVHKNEVTDSTWDQFKEAARPMKINLEGKPAGITIDRSLITPVIAEEIHEANLKRYPEEDKRAREAAARILDLEKTGNSKQIYRVNVQRCIERFGRHNTDQILKPQPHKDQDASPPEDTRGGPDTGSSEVQVAILTAKIRKLHAMMQKTNQDKHNKRNLRLLVHRRQKLVKYLRRKEKGGPRWQHMMETLGLTDGAWKGEITM